MLLFSVLFASSALALSITDSRIVPAAATTSNPFTTGPFSSLTSSINTSTSTASTSPPSTAFPFNCAGGSRLRKDVRDLTQLERDAFTKAFVRLVKEGKLDDMFSTHNDQFTVIHYVPYFLSWHRLFIREFEDRMQSILGPSWAMPYWDWSIDSQNPAGSVVFTADYFGTRDNVTGVVLDSPLAGLVVNKPSTHQVVRSYTNMTSLVHYSVIQSIVNGTGSFSQFSMDIEGTPHASVHININGDMSSRHSVNDIFFWLHHANVDRIYNQWQSVGTNANKYDGVQYAISYKFPGTADGNSMIPTYNVPASSTFDIKKLCYTYQNPSDVAFAMSMDANTKVITAPAPVTDKWVASMGTNVTQANMNLEKINSVVNVTNANSNMTGSIADPTLSNGTSVSFPGVNNSALGLITAGGLSLLVSSVFMILA